MEDWSRSPIIVIGMHRSGTSLVSRMLDRLGVFVGARLDGNHEATFFLRLNSWLLRQCGGSWDQPQHLDLLLSHERMMALSKAYIEYVLRSPRSVAYLGVRRYHAGQRIGSLGHPWGWKDPRNTYTLPLWLSIYPDAKVINVTRHGIDVAASLHTRFEKRLAEAEQRFAQQKWIYGWYEKRRGFAESMRTARLGGAFELWRDYVRRADLHAAAMGPRCLSVRFEELAMDPRVVLDRIVSFVGLAPGESVLAAAAGQPKPERAYAFRQSPELVAFADSVRGELSPYTE